MENDKFDLILKSILTSILFIFVSLILFIFLSVPRVFALTSDVSLRWIDRLGNEAYFKTIGSTGNATYNSNDYSRFWVAYIRQAGNQPSFTANANGRLNVQVLYSNALTIDQPLCNSIYLTSDSLIGVSNNTGSCRIKLVAYSDVFIDGVRYVNVTYDWSFTSGQISSADFVGITLEPFTSLSYVSTSTMYVYYSYYNTFTDASNDDVIDNANNNQQQTNDRLDNIDDTLNKNQQEQNKNKDEIIDNQNKNNEDLKDNQNQNTQDIIDNQNKNNEELKDTINDNFQSCRPSVNLFDDVFEIGYISPVTGLNEYNNANVRSKSFTKVQPNTKYILSYDTMPLYMNVFEYDANQNFIQRIFVPSSTAFVTSENTRYLRFGVNILDIYNFQVQVGESITLYEPYGLVCSNKLDDVNDKLDHMLGGSLNDNSQPDRGKLDDYNKAENGLIDKGSLNNINNIQISIDTNSNAFIWDLITKIINTHALVFGLFITMLSLGVVKLVLNR